MVKLAAVDEILRLDPYSWNKAVGYTFSDLMVYEHVLFPLLVQASMCTNAGLSYSLSVPTLCMWNSIKKTFTKAINSYRMCKLC